MNYYENLIFEGGGMKAISYAKIPTVLDKFGILQNIKRVAGSSAGSIAALLIALKYDPEEIEETISAMSFESFKDVHSYTFHFVNILTKNGINSGHYFEAWIKEKIRYKTNSKFTTFEEAYEMTGIELVVTGTNLKTGETEYFSYKNTPKMELWRAIRISISIPLFFKLIEYNNDLYMDGGILSNYPIWIFDSDSTYDLGPVDHEIDEFKHIKTLGFKLIPEESEKNLTSFFIPILNVVIGLVFLLLNYISVNNEMIYDNSANTVGINTLDISAVEFDLPDDKKKVLISNGEIATTRFLENKRRNELNRLKVNKEYSWMT